jgi:VIT1/CCC1 family predicted Fe2+/Mn2+ transporter
MTTSNNPEPDPLVPLRLALIAMIAAVLGAIVGLLTFMASPSVPQAVLAGLIAAGAAVLALDKLIGR